MYVCMYVCMCVYVCMGLVARRGGAYSYYTYYILILYIRAYIHTYIHTYTQWVFLTSVYRPVTQTTRG